MTDEEKTANEWLLRTLLAVVRERVEEARQNAIRLCDFGNEITNRIREICPHSFGVRKAFANDWEFGMTLKSFCEVCDAEMP